MVAHVQLREKAWFDSSLRLRASFGSPYPGHPKTSEILQPKLDSSQGPLDNFCVLTLDPKEVSSHCFVMPLPCILNSMDGYESMGHRAGEQLMCQYCSAILCQLLSPVSQL